MAKVSFQDSWCEQFSWLREGKLKGYAECVMCKKDIIYYGSMGRSAITSHSKGKKHVENEWNAKRTVSVKNFFSSKPIGLPSINTVTANPPKDLDALSSVPVSSQPIFQPQASTSMMSSSSVTVDLHTKCHLNRLNKISDGKLRLKSPKLKQCGVYSNCCFSQLPKKCGEFRWALSTGVP